MQNPVVIEEEMWRVQHEMSEFTVECQHGDLKGVVMVPKMHLFSFNFIVNSLNAQDIQMHTMLFLSSISLPFYLA